MNEEESIIQVRYQLCKNIRSNADVWHYTSDTMDPVNADLIKIDIHQWPVASVSLQGWLEPNHWNTATTMIPWTGWTRQQDSRTFQIDVDCPHSAGRRESALFPKQFFITDWFAGNANHVQDTRSGGKGRAGEAGKQWFTSETFPHT